MKKTTTQDGVFIHKSISCSNGVTPYEKSMEMKKILQETADQNTSAYILKKLKLYALARLEISDKKQDADDRQRQDCKKILEKTELLTAIIERPETSQDFLYTQFFDLGLLAQRADIRPLEPSVFRGIRYSEDQANRRDKRQTWGGKTREQIRVRDEEIAKAFKKSKLNSSNFSQKYASKYGLKSRRIREILKKALGSLPG